MTKIEMYFWGVRWWLGDCLEELMYIVDPTRRRDRQTELAAIATLIDIAYGNIKEADAQQCAFNAMKGIYEQN